MLWVCFVVCGLVVCVACDVSLYGVVCCVCGVVCVCGGG